MYRRDQDFKKLFDVVNEYDVSRRILFRTMAAHASANPGRPSAAGSSKDDAFASKTVLNRLDARGAEIESKVDDLAE